MNNIVEIGKCPTWVRKKASALAKQASNVRAKSKKLTGLKNCYSVKVASNYRMIFSNTSSFFLCSHDHYDKKIKNMKRQGA